MLIGLVFGIGISISGMANPAKVLNFFDVAGTWDPSLIFVMGGALAVTVHRLPLVLAPSRTAARRQVPPADSRRHRCPADRRLGGLRHRLGHRRASARAARCPRLGTGRIEVFAFVAALIAGILIATGLLASGARAARGAPETCTERRHAMTDYPIAHVRQARGRRRSSTRPTNTISYVVKDPASNACAVIDSVMDIDYAAGRITYDHADAIIAYIREHGLTLEWIIETHVHADHLSAAPYIQEQARRQDRHRREHHDRAGHLRQGLQRRHRVPARRQPVRPRCSRTATPTRSAA